jgi:predicted SprT family Zn-dependent metalloprotease
MKEYGCDGWTFGYNQRERSYGLCRYREKRIELNLRFAETASLKDIEQVIRHEIAHILASREGEYQHGPIWRYWAIQLGIEPERTCSLSGELTVRSPRYVAKCKNCGHVFSRRRKVKEGRVIWCAKCGPQLGQLQYEDNNG